MAKASEPDQAHSEGPQHYFTRRPQARSRPVEMRTEVHGLSLMLMTDRGVFSYGKVDAGSRLLAETMELPEDGELLDWGCGWGLLGIVAALTWPLARVTMVEVNERACDLARANAARNEAARVAVLCGDAAQVLGDRQFDAIVCNPPISAGRAAVLAMMANVAEHLRPQGCFWMVAHTKKGAKTLQRELASHFAEVEQVRMRSGYRVFKTARPLPQGGL